jgi:hypothetical protein
VGKIKVLYSFKIVSLLTFLKIVLLIVPINYKKLVEMREVSSKTYRPTVLHVKYPLFLSDFNGISNFSIDFRKKLLNIEFYKNSSRGSRGCSMRTDKRDVPPDTTNLMAGFLDFANASKQENKQT